MKRVRAGFCDYRYLSAWCSAVFRREGRRKNPEFFQRVERYQITGPSKRASRGQLAGAALAQVSSTAGGSQIGADSIHHKVICIRPLPIHTELALIVKVGGRQRDARRQIDE